MDTLAYFAGALPPLRFICEEFEAATEERPLQQRTRLPYHVQPTQFTSLPCWSGDDVGLLLTSLPDDYRKLECGPFHTRRRLYLFSRATSGEYGMILTSTASRCADTNNHSPHIHCYEAEKHSIDSARARFRRVVRDVRTHGLTRGERFPHAREFYSDQNQNKRCTEEYCKYRETQIEGLSTRTFVRIFRTNVVNMLKGIHPVS